jgi:hypothetical protein
LFVERFTAPVKESFMAKVRQKVMILYLSDSALDSDVKGWTFYDGTGKEHHTTGDSDQAPYNNGLDALLDGWRVIQFPQLIPPYPGMEYTTSFQLYEYIFEKLEEI